jgi:hypothetical protein
MDSDRHSDLSSETIRSFLNSTSYEEVDFSFMLSEDELEDLLNTDSSQFTLETTQKYCALSVSTLLNSSELSSKHD